MSASWPSLGDYNAAVQNPRLCFEDPDLRESLATRNRNGLPRVATGMYASVYELTRGGHSWAVRCFQHQVKDQQRRYDLLSTHLEGLPSKDQFLVGFKYLARGISVNRQWYPIVKMDWVRGCSLQTVVEDMLPYPGELLELAKKFRMLAAALNGLNMAHGDLQHGNILVTESNDLRLVDYDGMFVPSMRGEASPEGGHPNFAHPLRNASHFDAALDHFPSLLIFLCLRALAAKPELWKYNTGENLLLTEPDLKNPGESRAFRELESCGDPVVQTLARKLAGLCSVNPSRVPRLADILAEPMGDLFPRNLAEKRRPAPPPAAATMTARLPQAAALPASPGPGPIPSSGGRIPARLVAAAALASLAGLAAIGLHMRSENRRKELDHQQELGRQAELARVSRLESARAEVLGLAEKVRSAGEHAARIKDLMGSARRELAALAQAVNAAPIPDPEKNRQASKLAALAGDLEKAIAGVEAFSSLSLGVKASEVQWAESGDPRALAAQRQSLADMAGRGADLADKAARLVDAADRGLREGKAELDTAAALAGALASARDKAREARRVAQAAAEKIASAKARVEASSLKLDEVLGKARTPETKLLAEHLYQLEIKVNDTSRQAEAPLLAAKDNAVNADNAEDASEAESHAQKARLAAERAQTVAARVEGDAASYQLDLSALMRKLANQPGSP